MHQNIWTFINEGKRKLNNSLKKNSIQLIPNFIIPGGHRAGSTTLYYYLKQHPEIYLSEKKEPSYFSNFYRFGDKWYLDHFRVRKSYKAVGEASTTYLHREVVPKRMNKFNPDFKIIFILRNPVERAYSHYKKEIQIFGKPKPKLFKRILRGGKYYTHINRFLNYFPMENMYFLIFEEFLKNKKKYLEEICEFLDVNPHFKFNKNLVIRNESVMPLSLRLQQANNKIFGYDPDDFFIKKIFKIIFWFSINKINHIVNFNEFQNFSKKTLKYLHEYYKHEIEKLENLLHKELNFWKK